METITFELIRKIQREERDSPQLTQLPENFFEKVSAYLEQKKKIEKEDRKVSIELKNIERLVENIFDLRERKIINQAIITVRTNIPPKNLTPEEEKFFEQIVKVIKERRERFFSSIKKEKKKVRFKESVPEFVGIDGEIYGPFEKGEEGEIPVENFEILAKKGLVEEIK